MTWNLPENRDRLILHDEEDNGQGAEKHLSLTEKTYVVPLATPWRLPAENVPVQDAQDWAAEAERLIRNASVKRVLLTGPPGIGKTHRLQQLLPKGATDREIQWIDGSSDQLLRFAIVDLLDARFEAKATNKPWVIVVDEWHMMSEAQKREVLSWVAMRSNKTLLFAVGNRSDQLDLELFAQSARDGGNGDGVEGHFIRARGTVARFLEVYGQENDKAEAAIARRKFLISWLRCTRNLFGEEMLTLRSKEALDSAWAQMMGADRDEAIRNLIRFLHHKVAHLKPEFCDPLIRQLFNGSLQNGTGHSSTGSLTLFFFPPPDNASVIARLNTATSKGGPDVFAFLKDVSLLDLNEANLAYPNFSTDGIRESFQYHPVLRITTWIDYMMREGQKQHPSLQLPSDAFLDELATQLARFYIIDLPGRFPLMRPSNVQNLSRKWEHCQVRCGKLDPRRIEETIQLVHRGYGINIDEAKKLFATESVTDPKLFSRLVSIYPPAIHVLAPDNLLSLLRIGDDSLATETVKALHDSEMQQQALHKRIDMRPENAYYAALWKLYLAHSFTQVPEKPNDLLFIENLNRPAKLLDIACWASQNAYDMREIAEGSPAEFQFSLQQHLGRAILQAEASQDVAECAACADRCVDIYSNLFAPLLIPGDSGVSWSIALTVAARHYPPHPSWPLTVHALSALYHKHGTQSHLQLLNGDAKEAWGRLATAPCAEKWQCTLPEVYSTRF